LSLAKHRARRMAGFIQELCYRIRKDSTMTELSEAEIQKLITQFVRQVLDEDEQDRVMGVTPMKGKWYESRMLGYEVGRDMAREDLAENQYRNARQKVNDLLKDNQLELDEQSYSFKKLCREMLKAFVALNDIMERREVGDYSLEETVVATLPSVESVEESSEPISKVIEMYAGEQVLANRWTDKSKEEVLFSLAMLTEIIGDVPVKTIDHKVMRDFKQTLLKLPSNRNKISKYKDKTIKEILEMDIEKSLSISTVNKVLDRVSSLFNWAVKNGYMDRNPASSMQLPQDKRDDEYRDAFTPDDLRKIFHSNAYLEDNHSREHYFWLPVLGLFTGARIEELCQLHLDDIVEKDGVWVLDINDRDEKKLKNKQSRRLIPLHPFLTDDLRIIQYAESLKAKGRDRFFHELVRQRDGYSASPSKWFGYHRKALGITESTKTFHSFRHTFTNCLKQNLGVDFQMIKQLVGHGGDDITLDRYAKKYSAKVLLDNAIEKLGFDVDLEHLKRARIVTRL
jgi:integrase